MCPPRPHKTAVQILWEAAVECARRNPELWLKPWPAGAETTAEDQLDWLDWIGA